MNCAMFEHHIDAWIAGTLDSATTRMMDSHRDACAYCARLVEAQRAVNAALDAPPIKAPDNFMASLLARAASEAIPEVSPSLLPFPIASRAGLSCEIFERYAPSFTDGTLSGDLVAAMENHRASCPDCMTLAHAHDTVTIALRTAERVPAPAGLADRIFAAAARERAVAPARGLVSRMLPILAGIPTAAAFIAVAASFGRNESLPDAINGLAASINALPLLMKASIASFMPESIWITIHQCQLPVMIPVVGELPTFVLSAGVISVFISTILALVLLREPNHIVVGAGYRAK